MLIKRDMKCRTLYLSHTHYIWDLLSTYNMIEAYLVGTPMIRRSTILLGKSKDTEFNVTDYQRLVEKLMHLSPITRPNLVFIISKLGQYMADARWRHWRIAKRMLQYLKGTMTLWLKYSFNVKQHKASYGGPDLVGYDDSNYASETKSRQLTMGNIYYLNEVAVSWSSKRVKTVAVSLIETEYVALNNASKQTI